MPPVITVAVLLLPVLSLLLFGLDQVEDRWVTRPSKPSTARVRRRRRARPEHR
ncbi:hypothetical protein [Streptomyces griseofuscus]|uniref:hypothetical protein n=1 Tax=Streptomyces griseofuscus TaxID=146922 RepID=UPI00155AB0CE|nr:hypothetical protein [Streptomyces griseofuscus]